MKSKKMNQLHRFLWGLNYISDFFLDLRKTWKIVYQRHKKNPPNWSKENTNVVRTIKQQIKTLPCLGIPKPKAIMTVETDASNVGYRGMLKQKIDSTEQLVKYMYMEWCSSELFHN